MKDVVMNRKKWVGLDEPMGDCRCCVHQDECAPLKKGLNGHFLIEVDKNIKYGKSKKERPEGKFKCVVCGKVWDGSELYMDPQSLGLRWCCGDLTCGGSVIMVGVNQK